MKKFILILAIGFLGTLGMNAQSGISAGIHGAIPGGDSAFSDGYTLNLGLDVAYLTGEDEGIRYGGSLTYSRFLGDEVTVFGQTQSLDDVSFIEVKALGEYDFNETFYGSAGLGYAISAEGDGQDGGLVWMPAVGVKFGMLKVYGYYKSISDNATVASYGVGIGYNF